MFNLNFADSNHGPVVSEATAVTTAPLSYYSVTTRNIKVEAKINEKEFGKDHMFKINQSLP